MRRISVLIVIAPTLIALLSCGSAPAPEPLAKGLVLGLAVLKGGPNGPVPQPARVGILTRAGDVWSYRSIEDPDSNVFHKVMVYEPAPGQAGLLTAGGTKAMLKLWPSTGEPTLLWEADFGGKFSRMRDVEVGDIFGDGTAALAVATHDQGVVATVRPDGNGGWEATELDREPSTIVHEVELGDLDGDGVLEIYATPSLPNKLDGSPQPGQVVRYVPAKDEGRTVVADLGDRHAKEILAGDVDGDGRDELYVSVEAVAGGRVQILRFDADTPADGGIAIASLSDKMCRFLTAGDFDGDGNAEMVAAAHKSGLWLLKPGDDPRSEWSMSSIDRDSSGFEHASLAADLDGDGIDELYVANDGEGEVSLYTWGETGFEKTVIYSYPEGLSGFTWNIMTAPVELIP